MSKSCRQINCRKCHYSNHVSVAFLDYLQCKELMIWYINMFSCIYIKEGDTFSVVCISLAVGFGGKRARVEHSQTWIYTLGTNRSCQNWNSPRYQITEVAPASILIPWILDSTCSIMVQVMLINDHVWVPSNKMLCYWSSKFLQQLQEHVEVTLCIIGILGQFQHLWSRWSHFKYGYQADRLFLSKCAPFNLKEIYNGMFQP